MSSPLIVIPDTNLFFECLRLPDLPWADLAADPIELLLVKPVLDELDRHKKTQGRTRKRALEVFQLLRPLLSGPVRPHEIRPATPQVTLRLAIDLKPAPGLEALYNLDTTDEYLVAIVHTLQQQSTNARLLTHDTGPAAVAQAHKVACFMIPDGWLRPAEQSAEEKRVAELEREVQLLRRQEPTLVLKAPHASEKGILQHEVLSLTPLDTADIDHAIDRLKAAHPPASFDEPPVLPKEIRGLGSIESTPPSALAQNKYLGETYPAWLETCRHRISNLHAALSEPFPFVVEVVLENAGSRPAQDLRIEFKVEGSAAIMRLPDGDGDPPSKSDTPADQAVNLPVPPVPPRWESKLIPANKLALGPVELGAHPSAQRAAKQFAQALGVVGGRSVRDILADADGGPLAEMINPTPAFLNFSLPSVPRLSLPERDQEEFYYDNWNTSAGVTYGALTCRLFRHQTAPMPFAFEVVFPDQSTRNASLLCTVHAANLTTPLTLRLRLEQTGISRKPLEELQQLLLRAGVPPEVPASSV